MSPGYRKSSTGAPAGYFAWEAAGLRWLAEAAGAAVVQVLEAGRDHLELARVEPAPPTADAAEALGRDLARTHASGATAFGAAPPGWHGDGWLGPLSEPLPLVVGAWASWGAFYAEARMEPLARLGHDREVFDGADIDVLKRATHTVSSGALDTEDAPARLHGDLWSGNVLWSERGAVLIDPAAHGGHREADLAMLQLFGCPHLDRVLAAYDEARPLADGWRERVLLHQLHPLLLHAVLFGGSYVARSLSVARRYT